MLSVDPNRMGITAADVQDKYLSSATDTPNIAYNYAWPDTTGTHPEVGIVSTGEQFVPATKEEIGMHPWLKQYKVTGIKGAPNGGRNWGPRDVVNMNQPQGLMPFLTKGRRVPLYQEPVDAETIHRTKRTVTQEELYGNQFVPYRSDIAGWFLRDQIEDRIRSRPTASQFGTKDFQQPGAVYGKLNDSMLPSSEAKPGFAGGLMLPQRPTNKHTARVRLVRTQDAEHVVYPGRAPMRQTIQGTTHEHTIGELQLPRNINIVANTSARSSMQFATTRGKGAMATPSVRPPVVIAPTKRMVMGEWNGGSFAEEFAAHAGKNMHDTESVLTRAKPTDSYSTDPNQSKQCSKSHRVAFETAADPTVFAGAFVEEYPAAQPAYPAAQPAFTPRLLAPAHAGWFGAPHARHASKPPLRPASIANGQYGGLGRKAALMDSTQPNLRGQGFQHRNGTIERDKILGQRTHTQVMLEDPDYQPLQGHLNLKGGTGLETTVFESGRARPQDYRLTRRMLQSEDGHDDYIKPWRHNRTRTVQRALWLNTPAQQKKRTPFIVRDVDPAYLAPWFNNPYRNQPSGDGRGGVMPVERAPREVVYTGSMGDLNKFAQLDRDLVDRARESLQ